MGVGGGGAPWKFGFVNPYTFCMLNYLKGNPGGKAVIPSVNIHSLAVGDFLFFTVIGFCLFVTKAEKG